LISLYVMSASWDAKSFFLLEISVSVTDFHPISSPTQITLDENPYLVASGSNVTFRVVTHPLSISSPMFSYHWNLPGGDVLVTSGEIFLLVWIVD